jgi:hypothetical protein
VKAAPAMSDIIIKGKSLLLKNLEKCQSLFSFQDLNDHDIWNYHHSDTFHQFLQGFTPLSFSILIKEIVGTQIRTNDIIKSLHASLLKLVFHDVWIERCKEMQEFERDRNIDNNIKKRPCTGNNPITNISSPNYQDDYEQLTTLVFFRFFLLIRFFSFRHFGTWAWRRHIQVFLLFFHLLFVSFSFFFTN